MKIKKQQCEFTVAFGLMYIGFVIFFLDCCCDIP